ncbi:MAG: cytochrome c oxidase subunit 3 family protein [Myxococcaceae bacterium]
MSSPNSSQPFLAEHFATLNHQRHAARVGMWLFLISEVMLFAALFTAYATYRNLFPEAFAACSAHLDTAMGTVNTFVLLTSSLTVAFAVHYARHEKGRLAAFFFAASLLCAFLFLGIKAKEYAHHFNIGALPGKYYSLQEIQLPGASLFYTFYFFSTGLHAIHVLIGMGLLIWVGVRSWRNEFTAEHYTAPEFAGMYWHLVDLVWIFLYPLLYLI